MYQLAQEVSQRSILDALGTGLKATFMTAKLTNHIFRCLQASWRHLGRSWNPFGSPLGPQELSWGLLGASWEPLGVVLDASQGLQGASWGLLGASWDFLGASWGLLGAPQGLLGASWRPPWGALKLLECHLGLLRHHLGLKNAPQRHPKSIPNAPKKAFGRYSAFRRSLHAIA